MENERGRVGRGYYRAVGSPREGVRFVPTEIAARIRHRTRAQERRLDDERSDHRAIVADLERNAL